MSVTKCIACQQPLEQTTSTHLHPSCEINPEILATELFQMISDEITNQPRSQQKRIGPSELGVPCDRRIAYRLSGIDAINDRGPAWKPYVGTAVHEQMANMMARAEVKRITANPDAGTRWHVEEKLTVGEIGGTSITGSCDLFDAANGAVWDWKFTTRNQIRENYRPQGPGQQYRVQAHLYGRGWERAAYEVRTVGVIFLTRDGELTDRHVWWEPYDRQIALDALDRANKIANALDALGPAFTLDTLPTADAHCRFCPWYRAGSSELVTGCPGQEQPQKSLEQLIGA